MKNIVKTKIKLITLSRDKNTIIDNIINEDIILFLIQINSGSLFSQPMSNTFNKNELINNKAINN